MKRAYLMSPTDATGATFSVRDAGGTAVLSGSVPASLGSWSGAYSFVHPIDFDGLAAPGMYSIAVTGAVSASSPSFRVDSGQNVYAGALENALSFYETERDGPNYIPNALRSAPAHTNDQNAMTYIAPKVNSAGRFSGDLQSLGLRIDASGGWWDAGDYIKGVQTLGYTTAILPHGVRELPAQMGAGSATADFTAEAKFGTDFLLRLWDDDTRTLHHQVGIGSGNAKTVGDHDIWRLPQADDTFGGADPLYRYIRERLVFRAGPPGSPISPNLAGRDAAVFATCFQVYKTTDPAFANRCLVAAQHIFDLADTNPGRLTTYIPFSF
jgi:endoglucanase